MWVVAQCSTTRRGDRKSTRLNSSHGYISYAVFCLKKKTQPTRQRPAAQHTPAGLARATRPARLPAAMRARGSWVLQPSVLGGLVLDLFFFNDTATTEIYPLSLHDALPISSARGSTSSPPRNESRFLIRRGLDRKSTRLNSSHGYISYAVFCFKK